MRTEDTKALHIRTYSIRVKASSEVERRIEKKSMHVEQMETRFFKRWTVEDMLRLKSEHEKARDLYLANVRSVKQHALILKKKVRRLRRYSLSIQRYSLSIQSITSHI